MRCALNCVVGLVCAFLAGVDGYTPPLLFMSMRMHVNEADVVVIGSGIGGLCTAGMLAKYGQKVIVCESHYLPGGVAHAFEKDGYIFDAGPSLWAGCGESSTNPLRQVLDVLDEADKIEWIKYDGWGMLVPDKGGYFRFRVGPTDFEKVLLEFGGEEDLQAWRALTVAMRPLLAAAVTIPPMALRGDQFTGLMLFPYIVMALLKAGLRVQMLQEPFSAVMEGIVPKGCFLYRWLDYLSFALSGVPADRTQAAAVVYTIGDLFRPGCLLDYPRGGGGAVINALVRGMERHGGKLLLKAHVARILVEGGEAKGVLLKDGTVIKARKAVVSNASVWDTVSKLLPPGAVSEEWATEKMETPDTGSFMHLHLGIDATGLENSGLDIHYSIVESWDVPIDAPQNMFIVSIPTVLDPSLAPEGKHVVHIYTAGNEPYEIWKDLKRGSPEYKAFKEERAQGMWRALERIIPDIRQRVEVEMVASPLTHEYYARRYKGSYGPAAFVPGKSNFPGPKLTSQIKKLYHCGDSTQPGLGLPAAAASGMNAANTIVPLRQHIAMFNKMKKDGYLVNRFEDF